MPYKVDWLIEDEILLYVFWGAMKEDDLHGAFTEMINLIKDSSNDSIHTISDINQITHNIRMQDSMKIVRKYRDQTQTDGWTITVGKLDIVMKMAVKVSQSVLGQKAISFDTMEKAFDHLKKHDSSVSWDKINIAFLDFVDPDKAF